MFEKIQVGKLYREGKTRYNEGVLFNVTNTGLQLEVYFDNPTESEINNFKSESPYKFGLFKKDGILFFLSKFGNLNWMDAPYSVGLCENIDSIVLQELPPTSGYALTVFLIDAATGILVSSRLIGLQHKFSKVFKTEFDKQKALGKVDRFEYSNTLNKIFATYSSNDMVKNSLITYSGNQ